MYYITGQAYISVDLLRLILVLYVTLRYLPQSTDSHLRGLMQAQL